MWPLAETGPFSSSKPRESRAHASLPTRSTDSTPLDNPAAAGSFFSLPPVTLPRLVARPFSCSPSRPLSPRRSLPVTCARSHSRLSTLGGETTVPPSRPQLVNLADCLVEAVPILPFPPPFLTGTAGWRHLLRPGGAALLCFPATRDPPGFRSLPKDWPALALATQRIFSAAPEKAQLGLGSRRHLL